MITLTIEDIQSIVAKTPCRLSAVGVVYSIINIDTDEEVTSRYASIDEAWNEFQQTWIVGTFTVLTTYTSNI